MNTTPMPTARRNPYVIFLYTGLALVAAAIVVAGVIWLDQPFGPVVLGTGILGGILIGVGAAQRSALLAVYGLLVAMGLGLAVSGAVLASAELVAAGVIAVVLAGSTAPIAVIAGGRQESRAPSELLKAVDRLVDNTMLSDNAKRALFREHEISLLKEAIEQDIQAGKYFTAMKLCTELGEVFGDREDSELYRTRILEANQSRYEEDATAALSQLDEMLVARNWQGAQLQKARMERLFSESMQMADLEARIVRARSEHKAELEAEFLRASEREDVEAAMELLRDLDRYLTNVEAERLREVAEGIVTRHRDNLGLRFKLAVADKRWAEAARAGEEIISEFPNAKMADEVRGMLDVLRTREAESRQ